MDTLVYNACLQEILAKLLHTTIFILEESQKEKC